VGIERLASIALARAAAVPRSGFASPSAAGAAAVLPSPAAASTSSLVIRPPTPDPLTPRRSTPFAWAARRATGVALAPSAGSTASPAGGALGASAGAGSAAGPGGPGGPAGEAPGPSATGATIPALPEPREFVETSALRDIHFDFDKYEIRPPDGSILAENAQWLKSNPTTQLLIEGHADERGTNEYNLALAERRAKATRDYLVSVGIDAQRISVIPYGEERPLCTERTEACWAQNRRAHFLVKP